MAVLIFSACSRKTTVVLLPDPGGKVGHITVMTNVGAVDITRPSEASTISGKDSLPSPPQHLPMDKLNAEFSKVLALLPTQPVHFILHFYPGSTKLTPESLKMLPEIIKSIQRRDSHDIGVIGHSDTAGDPKYNLYLSTRRAEAVSRLLIQHGIKDNEIKSTSHGENNPLIKTADNVSEARNRRVEVVIR